MATGDYLYWGSADDMVLPGFFESAMSLLEDFPTAPLCAGVPVHWHETLDQQFETCIGMPREPGFIRPEELWPLARRGSLDTGGAWALYRVADLTEIGGFHISLKWLADWYLVYALSLGRGLAWTARPTAAMRFHAKNYSRIGPDRQREQSQVLAMLAQIIVTEMPVDLQNGFRSSGILGQLAWPMVKTLLSKRRYWPQLSIPFWRVYLGIAANRAATSIGRVIVPQRLRRPLRRAIGQKLPSPTAFDLSAMESRKAK